MFGIEQYCCCNKTSIFSMLHDACVVSMGVVMGLFMSEVQSRYYARVYFNSNQWATLCSCKVIMVWYVYQKAGNHMHLGGGG